MNPMEWLTTQVPALPQTWLMRLDLSLGWALVLALLSAVLGKRLPLLARRLLAGALVLWTLTPGTLSLDHWLGLAFHAPSLSAQLLCLVFLRRLLFPQSVAKALVPGHRSCLAMYLTMAGYVVLGYLLLLDTFAVLPLQMYAWGFSPAALLALLGLSLLPWVLRGADAQLRLVPLALLLFAATRLPTGNVWDAVLDPWLWLLLQLALLRAGFKRLRGSR